MSVSVELPRSLARFAGGEHQFDTQARTVGAVMTELFERFPDLKIRLVNDRGEMYPYLPGFVNNEKLPLTGYSGRVLTTGDKLEFVTLASGG